MKEMNIDVDLIYTPRRNRFFAPLVGLVIVILVGVLTYTLSVSAQVVPSLP